MWYHKFIIFIVKHKGGNSVSNQIILGEVYHYLSHPLILLRFSEVIQYHLSKASITESIDILNFFQHWRGETGAKL